MAWMIATKLEMTRVIKDDRFLPITLLQIPEMKVVWMKTAEKDGYDALIVWVCNKKCEWNLWEDKVTLNKSEFNTIREFPLNKDEIDKFKVWDTIGLDNLEWVESVSIEWISKWKWFTWAMARHNFHGWPGWHGSKFHRALGSIGNRKPTRTHKWKKMHGHHWDFKVTLKWLSIDMMNKELWVIGVRGWVPGWRNSLIKIMF
jgi:large subunit ribosomal protein L3